MRVIKRKNPFLALFQSLPVLLLLLSVPLTLYLLGQQIDIRQQAEEKAGIYVVSSTQKVAIGETLTLEALVNAGGNNTVSQVQVNLSYPSQKLTPIGIDTNGTAFDVETEYIAGGGLLKLGRQASIPVAGSKRIALIRFRALQETEYTEIQSTPGSVVLRSSDKQNILGKNITVSTTRPPEGKPASESKPLWEVLFLSIKEGFLTIFSRGN